MAELVNKAREEFGKYLKKWVIENNRFSNGIDVGAGTSRCDDMIVSIDQQPDYRYAHAQLVWDCANLEIFANDKLDFIFSSHCLEDFEDIPTVFCNWWKKLKIGGLMLLLLPSMEICNCEFCKGKSRYVPVGSPNGNPSHRTNTGRQFLEKMLADLKKSDRIIDYAVEQIDSIPHNESSSVDIVIRKIK